MNLSDIKYRSMSSSSLSFGSTFTEDDLQFYTNDNWSKNFPFSKLDKDFVKLSVFNLDGSVVTSSAIWVGGDYTAHTQSYYDVRNDLVTYSYTVFDSNWLTVGTVTKSLFIDVSKELNGLGVSDGNYIVGMELLRNMVGSESASQDKLLINKISTTRDEISLIPKQQAISTSSFMDDFNNFSNDKFKLKEVAQDFLDSMSSPQIYTAYYSVAKTNPTGAESLKFNYGFNSRTTDQVTGSVHFNNRGVSRNGDIDVIGFITDMYYGVRKGNLRASGQYAINDIIGVFDQFQNWMLLNYETGVSFQDIKDYYYSLFRYVVEVELNHITNKRPSDYDNIVAFLQEIFYDKLFYTNETLIETKYNADLSGYFKNYVNFSSGLGISILNRKFIPSTDTDFVGELVLKLDSPLPLTVDVEDEVWITNNFGFLPIVQNVYYFTKPSFDTIRLRGPNFLVKIEQEGNSTEAMSMEDLLEETGSLYNELVSKLGARASGSVDNTDYRYFENFVNFSSAELRMSAYDWKASQITTLQETIAGLEASLAENPSDTFYAMDLSTANSTLDNIEASMDGYETFLYNNNLWYDTHAESASLYDRNNGGSLINSLPQFIVEDAENNSDYITFVGMVGHFFDNLLISTKQLTEKNNYAISPSTGISLEIVGDMLSSLGWETEISKDNLPLILSSFSKRDFDVGSEFYDAARTFSEEERNQVIWKRILNSLPYLYKTKGTEAGLDVLITCFGIPKNIIKIKEFGGIYNASSLQDTTTYVLDEVKYEPYFSGSGEYFQLDWTGSAQTLEFNFAFDPTKTSDEGKIFRLVNCSGSWAVGAYRERGLDWGRLFFSLSDGSGSVQTIMTGKAPLFDGGTYHAMLRRSNPIDAYSLNSASAAAVDAYPIKYSLRVERAADARVTFVATSSYYFSGSFNENFRLGDSLYIGNYDQSTASLSIDPEAFFGNIDEVKLWESPLSDDRFTNHTLHQNAYDLDSPQQMIEENLIRISFERPVNLYDASTSSSLNNLAFRGDFPTFLAHNFPPYFGPAPIVTECDTGYASVFPYQFTRKDTHQTVKLPSYGAGKFKSNKINYVEQQLVSNLSPTQRASVQSSKLVSVDSNRLGIFFSPSETQNMEIIKFFGDYPLMDLIGDPSSVYESSYRKFEKFKQVFYSQGFGAVDYQFFMNIVRFYFDKAMFKYIRSMVPARAKLIDGILIEPSILERPKIQSKQIVQESIDQRLALVDAKQTPIVTKVPQMSVALAFRDFGTSILNDVNQNFYPISEDKYGFGIFPDARGLTLYNGHYYRVDTVETEKKFQIYNRYNLPSSSLNDYENRTNLHGTVQTITRRYKKTELTRLPTVTEYPMTMSFADITASFYFSGSVSFTPAFQGSGLSYQLLNTHTISGKVTGSVSGFDPRVSSDPNAYSFATIRSSGLHFYATASISSTGSILYFGDYSLNGGAQMFEGTVSFIGVGSVDPTDNVYEHATYNGVFASQDGTSSIFNEFSDNTFPGNNMFLSTAAGLGYRKEISLRTYPINAQLATGYSPTHYKYGKEQFSQKLVNSYDQSNRSVKWRKGSQNKKTTIDPSSGLLDNSSPIETKTT